MTLLNFNFPRFTHRLNYPLTEDLNYEFCFLNRPFVSLDNPKDVYYKLLVWPKAHKKIEDFEFLIKIHHQDMLKPLEISVPPGGEGKTDYFDPSYDSHLTIKIPQNLYKVEMEFAFSFMAFKSENFGQLFLNLSQSEPYKIDNQLIFYDLKSSEATNLLTWHLTPIMYDLTFNTTYLNFFKLDVHLQDLTTQSINYESVKRLRFLALLGARPTLRKFHIESANNIKKPYDFEPILQWWDRKNLNSHSYFLQLLNQLTLRDNQIQESSEAEQGLRLNPYVLGNQVLSIEFSFLAQTFRFSKSIIQANLYFRDKWQGAYFEV